MRRMILLVVFSLLACAVVQAEVNRIGRRPSGDRHHDRGSKPRVTITFGFGQQGWPIIPQPCQPAYGYGWPTPQYNPGYFPGTSPVYGGYQQYGYGGANAAYAEAYRQRLEQLERQRRYQIEEAARQAGRRAAEQQFNYGGWGY